VSVAVSAGVEAFPLSIAVIVSAAPEAAALVMAAFEQEYVVDATVHVIVSVAGLPMARVPLT
jgi:hypothetical protein